MTLIGDIYGGVGASVVEFHGNKHTASAHKDHPVLKVKATRNRDRGANALLHTASLFRIGHQHCVWHMLLEWNEPKLQLLPLKPCSANNLDPITKVLWSCLAFRLLMSNLEMAGKVSEKSQMAWRFQSLPQIKHRRLIGSSAVVCLQD